MENNDPALSETIQLLWFISVTKSIYISHMEKQIGALSSVDPRQFIIKSNAKRQSSLKKIWWQVAQGQPIYLALES